MHWKPDLPSPDCHVRQLERQRRRPLPMSLSYVSLSKFSWIQYWSTLKICSLLEFSLRNVLPKITSSFSTLTTSLEKIKAGQVERKKKECNSCQKDFLSGCLRKTVETHSKQCAADRTQQESIRTPPHLWWYCLCLGWNTLMRTCHGCSVMSLSRPPNMRYMGWFSMLFCRRPHDSADTTTTMMELSLVAAIRRKGNGFRLTSAVSRWRTRAKCGWYWRTSHW